MSDTPMPSPALYAAALRFRDLAPWKSIADDDMFGVVDPVSGQVAYCSVMGMLGEFLGLGVYIGEPGWRCLMDLSQASEDGQTGGTEALYQQDCIVCSFEAAQEVDPNDLEAYLEAGLETPDNDTLVPCFRRYKPGQMPWRLDQAELALVQVVLEQAMAMCAAQLEAGLPEGVELGNFEGHPIWCRKQGADGAWGYEAVNAGSPVDLSPPQASVEPDVLARVQALPKVDAILLFEHFHIDMPSMAEGMDRPFFPKALVLFNVEEPGFLGVEAMQPDEWLAASGTFLATTFLEMEARPAQLLVASRKNYILLKALCKSMGVDLYLDGEMEMVDELREAVMSILNGDDDEEEEEED